MICPNCGKEISDNSKFCGFCGVKVEVPAPAPEPAAAPEQPAPVPEPVAAPVEEPVAAPEQPAPAPEPVAAPVEEPAAAPEQPIPAAAPVQSEPVPNPIPMQGQPVPNPMPMQGQPVPNPMPMQGQPVPNPMPMQGQPMPNPMPMQGMPAASQPTAPAPKKKGKAGLIVVIILLVLIIVACGALAFLWINRPINKIEKAFAAGDVETVAVLYEDLKSDADKDAAAEMALRYATERYDAYISEAEGADYDTVSRELDYLYASALEDDSKLYQMINEISQIEESREAFADAEALKAAGDYVAAMEEYAQVSEYDSKNYDNAQSAIGECKDLFRRAALDEADSCINNGDFNAARWALEDALAVLSEDADLQAKMTEVDSAEYAKVVADAEAAANTAVAEGRYQDALDIINDALAEYPDSTELSGMSGEIISQMYAASPIIGTWSLEYDLGPMLADEMGEEFADFESTLPLTIQFDFSEDGTCRLYIDEDSFLESFYAWEDDFVEYSMDIMYAMFKDSGISKKDADALVKEVYGYTMEEYMRMLIDEELNTDELISMMESAGVYMTDGDKIYLADTEDELAYASYDTFVLEGDMLTFYNPNGDGEEILPGLAYPLVFYRVTAAN